MNKLRLIRFGFFIFFAGFLSCNTYKSEPSFYFWRTNAALSSKEKETIAHHNIRVLYVRFFDVDIPPGLQKPQPLGVIDSLELIPNTVSVIPVVYITNHTFLNLKNPQVIELAANVVKKVKGLQKNYKELQIDCDWSEKTKEVYFAFLREVKKLSGNTVWLTATVRLHQIKYPVRSGVPPVNGGMLMFYNMGNIHNLQGPNSIFDAGIAAKYTNYIKDYALHLDVALPIFKWCILYRNEKVIGLITKNRLPQTHDTTYFSAEKNSIFKVKKPQLINGVYYKTNDILKYETLNDEELLKAAELLKKSLSPDNRRIVLYDLDELNINYYETETIETVFSTFN